MSKTNLIFSRAVTASVLSLRVTHTADHLISPNALRLSIYEDLHKVHVDTLTPHYL
jgi:hypothetical protein